MSTTTEGKRDVMHSKWTIPAFSVAMGVVLLGANIAGHQLVLGLWSLGIMVLFGAAVLLGGRSETVRGLRGDGRDERFAMLDLQATAMAGLALIIAVIVAFIVEVARGHSGEPYDWLGAIGGLAYLAAVIVFRVRG
jgi:drug/metabolite transporter (DMT)-like permease